MRLRKLVLAVVAAVALAAPSAAAAQTDPYVSRPPEVGGQDQGRPTEVQGVDASREAPAPAAPSAEASRGAVQSSGETRSQTLPVTGGDIVGLTVIGLAAIAGGTVLVRRSRRDSVAA